MSRSSEYGDYAFIAELYDFVPGYANRPDTDFYLDFCRSADGKILELGCGTGRILIPAAAAGCSIVGLDLSEHMLARCREKLQSQPEEVRARARIVQGDMTNFDLKETFSLVIIPFRPFQHLVSIADQMACLQCIHRHLADDGRLVFDLFQVDPRKMYGPTFTAEESEDFSGVDLPEGRKLRRTHRIAAHHWVEQYNDVELICYVTHPDGRTERLVQAFPMRYFFRYEVEHLLTRCGFRIAELFGNFDRSPLTDDSPEMIFVAEKWAES
jgi:SAM-dependent methyltransferase